MSRRKQSVASGANPARAPSPERDRGSLSMSRMNWLWMGALLLAAALVRLLFLGRAELWQDELIFIRIALPESTPWQIFLASWEYVLTIGQLPLAFMVFNMVYHVMDWFGISVDLTTAYAARIPAVLWGVPAVFGMFLLARRVADEAVAWGAALMMAFFFFPVYYSREAYVYAQVICLTPFAAYLLIRIVFDGKHGTWRMVGLVACLLGLLYAHMGALLMVLAMAAPVFSWWVWLLMRREHGQRCTSLFWAGLMIAVSLALASPHLLRFLLFNEAHQSGAPFSLWVILNDGVNKLFMGERAIAVLLSWGVFAAGIAGLMVPGPRAGERRLIGTMTLLGLVLITLATHRSQYLSVRYFAPVTPLVYVVFAVGLAWSAAQLARACRRPAIGRLVYAVLVGLSLGVHLVVFIPALLQLEYKSVPFGLIADWINENLDEGTPYVMESAYEIRFVGGGYPTPGRIPVSPYVHGSGPEEVHRLHEAQQDFIRRFPVSAFVQSAHHNWDQPQGVWTWPHEFYHRHYRIAATEPLRHLITVGINPGLPYEVIGDLSYRIDIYYNTWDDLVGAARESATPLLLDYPGWFIQRQQHLPMQALYFRIQGGPRGQWVLHHVGEEQVDGAIRIDASLAGPEGAGPMTLELGIAGQATTPIQVRPGHRFQYSIPFEQLAPGAHPVRWQVRGAGREGVHLILIDAQPVVSAG